MTVGARASRPLLPSKTSKSKFKWEKSLSRRYFRKNRLWYGAARGPQPNEFLRALCAFPASTQRALRVSVGSVFSLSRLREHGEINFVVHQRRTDYSSRSVAVLARRCRSNCRFAPTLRATGIAPKAQFYRNKVSHFKRRENLAQRDGESGQHLRFLEGVARICTADLRFELARNVAVGKPRGGVEEPLGPTAGGEVLRHLQD